MRKIIWKFLVAATLLTGISFNLNAQEYKREGTVFVSTAKAKSKGEAKKTRFTWKESDGTEYPIYRGASGSCFINKVSKKTGKEYRKYLGKEVSAEIGKLSSNISIPDNPYRNKRK